MQSAAFPTDQISKPNPKPKTALITILLLFESGQQQQLNMGDRVKTAPTGNCKFAIPKKGRLYEKVEELLKGSGIDYHRAERLDVALCVGLPITLVFLPAADIAKYVGEGNVDLGITGYDVIQESNVNVEHVMTLGFGKCKLCVQALIANNVTDVSSLAGGRIVTSFPFLTEKFFRPYDLVKGVKTHIIEVSGSVEAACGLGLADAVVDLVETGTTMKVRNTISIFFTSLNDFI